MANVVRLDITNGAVNKYPNTGWVYIFFYLIYLKIPQQPRPSLLQEEADISITDDDDDISTSSGIIFSYINTTKSQSYSVYSSTIIGENCIYGPK